MKEICFTFDAFGQWSEQGRSIVCCGMKVGVEWRLSVAARPNIYGRSATFPLFSLLLSSPLSQPPHLGEKLESFQPHGLATYLGWPATPWLPYKRAAKGSLVLHPTSSQA
jgi:hypothetical protein